MQDGTAGQQGLAAELGGQLGLPAVDIGRADPLDGRSPTRAGHGAGGGSRLPPAWWGCGLSYVLEVELAKEAIRVWREHRAGAEPSSAQRYAAVIYYAVNDAFLED